MLALRLARTARTAYKNAHPDPLQAASSAIYPEPPAYDESVTAPPLVDTKDDHSYDQDLQTSTSLTNVDTSAVTKVSEAMAIFPQYVVTRPTTIILEEHLESFEGDFTIRDESGNDLFKVHRQRPSASMRQTVTDAKTNEPLMVIRRDPGSTPPSYHFEDPVGNLILLLPGSARMPGGGTKAKAAFKNAFNGRDVHLTTHGNRRMHQGEIKVAVTNEVCALMSSQRFTPKTIIGHRRTYAVRIAAGVDMLMIASLIISMDSRL